MLENQLGSLPELITSSGVGIRAYPLRDLFFRGRTGLLLSMGLLIGPVAVIWRFEFLGLIGCYACCVGSLFSLFRTSRAVSWTPTPGGTPYGSLVGSGLDMPIAMVSYCSSGAPAADTVDIFFLTISIPQFVRLLLLSRGSLVAIQWFLLMMRT